MAMFVEQSTATYFGKLDAEVLSYQITLVKIRSGDTEIWDFQTKVSVYSPDGESFVIRSKAEPKEGFSVS